MKLTVGRIVHAYRVRDFPDGEEKSGPFAAIVVGLGVGSAALRVLSPLDADLDHIKLVEPLAGVIYRKPGCREGWLWLPRES